MNKKIIFSIIFSLALFLSGIISGIPMANASDTCSAGTTCSDSGGGCKYCSVTNRSTGAGYYTGGSLTIPCSASSPVSCWIDAGCWRSNQAPTYGTAIFGSATTATPPTFLGASGTGCCTASNCTATPPVCKVATCSSNTCAYTANAANGTSCGTNKQCQSGVCVNIPSCVGYSHTVSSGGTVYSAVSGANANMWSAVCREFSCGSYVCNYSAGYVQNYSGGSFSGTFGSESQFYNTSGSAKTRTCTYTVWDSANPGLTGTCTGTQTVNSGVGPVTPTPPAGVSCVGYSHTVNSGGTVYSAVSGANANMWSAVCREFSCGSYVCNYSAGYVQNYSGGSFSGSFGSESQFYNTSGSAKTRTCTYTVWDSANPSVTGTCTGTQTVNSGAGPATPPASVSCVGYSNTVNSGETVHSAVSGANSNMWSAVCREFSCSGYVCNYSAGYTQNYPGGAFTGTFDAEHQFFNTSGSTKTRTCNFSVWNSADPTVTGTCTGTNRVCSEGYTWNGISCTSCGGSCTCVVDGVCAANTCIGSSCLNNCGTYSAGTKVCSTPTPTPTITPTPTPTITPTPTPLYSCTGLFPPGAVMCSGDDAGLTSNVDWIQVSRASNCTSARKCQYYFPSGVGYCRTPNPPAGTMCTDDNVNVPTASLSWRNVGEDSSSCTDGRKCQYYVCNDRTWTPANNTICTGTAFTQTSNCGATRPAVGTMVGVCLPLTCNAGDCGVKPGAGSCPGMTCSSVNCECNSGKWIER
ncbi:MAG: hypothetical protein WAV31_00680 [Candidatus Moraniibacteriota bacterium]